MRLDQSVLRKCLARVLQACLAAVSLKCVFPTVFYMCVCVFATVSCQECPTKVSEKSVFTRFYKSVLQERLYRESPAKTSYILET